MRADSATSSIAPASPKARVCEETSRGAGGLGADGKLKGFHDAEHAEQRGRGGNEAEWRADGAVEQGCGMEGVARGSRVAIEGIGWER